MRFDTAVNRLRTIAQACTEVCRFRDELVAAYVYGELLNGTDVEVVDVALTVDAAAEELPWRAEPGWLRALADVLRLGKAPVRWVWRPAGEPAAHPLIVGPVRFWTAESGTDADVLDTLAQRHLAALPRELVDPADAAVLLSRERDRSMHHLRQVVDRYWEPSWRQ